MSSPKNLSPTPQSNPNPSLPDDLILSCVARVSRLYYPTLSLVSKSFRSLLASPELYKARSFLDRNESCLYVCLQSASWFTLCRKPDQTLTYDTRNKKKSSGYVLATVPIPHHAHVQRSSFVAVGSCCEIENVLYSVCNGAFNWYDTEVRMWRKLKGLVGLPTFSIRDCVFYYGGKMAVLWDEVLLTTCNKKMIWCAEITLERRSSCKILGKVEWFDHVLTVPITYVLEKILVATI